MSEYTVTPVALGAVDPGLDALIHAMFLEICGRYPDRAFDESIWRAEAGAQARYLVARIGERAVGCCAVQPNPDSGRTGMELKRMYIASDARGAGLADALLRAAEDLAASLGAAEIYLHTGNRQPEARRVYERNGYAPIPAYGAYGDDPISCCYAKQLTQRADAFDEADTADPADEAVAS